MTKTIVETDKAPKAIGPYSQAVKTESMIFVSGQLAIHPESGDLITEDIKTEARQALTNLKAILAEAGSSLDKVVKTTLFITDMQAFPAVNDVYAEFFPSLSPARSCVQVSGLPKGANVEVEAIALTGHP